jgi:hypothetical protein
MKIASYKIERERDFTQPIGADFIVALKARNQEFCLFVESFFTKNGKSYLKHTTDISLAKRLSRIGAEEVVEQVKEYRCTGRVERVSPDNKHRTVVPPLGNKPPLGDLDLAVRVG